MTVAAAGRRWWAAYRLLGGSSLRSPAGESQAGTEAGTESGESQDTRAARLMLFLPAFFAAGMILCAAIGFAVTQFGESRLEAQQHAALRRALEEVRADTGSVEDVDGALVRLVERRAGLKELRFDADPPEDSGREMQSLHDARGRIIGWFSWVTDNALVRAMNRLWGLLGGGGFCTRRGRIFGRCAPRGISCVRSTEVPRRRASWSGKTL